MPATRVLLTVLALASAAVTHAQPAGGPATTPPANPLRAYGPVGLPAGVRQASAEAPITESPNSETPAAADQAVAEGSAALPPLTLDEQPAASPAPPTDSSALPTTATPPVAAPASPGQAAAMEPPVSTPPTPSADDSFRRLAPPTPSSQAPTAGERPRLLGFSWDDLPVEPATSAAALGLVVGLFLLTAAVFKRAAPKSQRLLPGEVASVLGRISLGGKQSAHLLKVGSKLVLVHITPEGAKPLTEVTDPAEVSRLLGLCEQGGEHSASTAFADVFEKLTAEPATPGFLGGESPLVDRQELAAAYANTPGGRGGR